MSDVSDAEGADGAAAQPLRVDHFRVEHGDGLTVPVFTLPNRAAAGAPLVKFVLQRDLETTLYGSTGSGAGWKMLRDLGMGSTSLQCSSRAVSDGLLTQGEFDAIIKAFKEKLADTDPSSIGRVRMCTLLPLSVAAACARTFGRCGASLAWLRAFSAPVPEVRPCTAVAPVSPPPLQPTRFFLPYMRRTHLESRRGSSKSKPMPMPPPACKISSSRSSWSRWSSRASRPRSTRLPRSSRRWPPSLPTRRMTSA